MNNKIYNVTSNEVESIKLKVSKENEVYLAILEGRQCQTWSDFLDKMSKMFRFPELWSHNTNAYLDWMRDLDWLNKEKYILIINGYNEFFKDASEEKNRAIRLFNEVILPFWENEVQEVVMGGYPKSFQVYLVD